MVKGWNSNRGWNNGWGANRKSRNGSRDLTWVNHSTIETVRRVQNEPTDEQKRATAREASTGTETIGMDQTDGSLPVLK